MRNSFIILDIGSGYARNLHKAY